MHDSKQRNITIPNEQEGNVAKVVGKKKKNKEKKKLGFGRESKFEKQDKVFN